MIQIIAFLIVIYNQPNSNTSERTFIIEDSEVKTTFAVDEKFLGTYQGRKNGFLTLKMDGTGEYLYDIYFPNKSCKRDTIQIEWGFILDENDKIAKFERSYGYSFPIIYKAIGEISFQNCTRKIMIDYILEYNVDEFLTVSSSDDWKKSIPYREMQKETIEKAVEQRFKNH